MIYSIEWLAKKYQYSLVAVKSLAKIYGLKDTSSILYSLRSPGSRYFLRVNTLKATAGEVVARLRNQGLAAKSLREVCDAIYFDTKGPFPVNIHEKIVVADKAASESVYMGANLYAPGVVEAEKIEAGDVVTIVNPVGIPVAEGVATMNREDIFSTRRGLAIMTLRSVYSVPSIRESEVYINGLVYDQSLPSIISIHILSPKPGWVLLDMCAAPGGKATHAAQLMKDEGEIIAVDRSPGKIRRIEENIRRLGLKSIKTVLYDSRYIDDIMGANEVDAIILDPPCTALGVRPKLFYNRDEKVFLSLPNYQRQFIKVAYKVLRKGGLMLYTTCTLTLEENEANVLYAIKLGFNVKEIRSTFGKRGYLGLPVIRFEPHIHDTPGFFIALLEKPT